MADQTGRMGSLSLRLRLRRRMSPTRLLLISSTVFIGCLSAIFSTRYGVQYYNTNHPQLLTSHQVNLRHLLAVTTAPSQNVTQDRCYRPPVNVSSNPLENMGEFPRDAFTLEQLRQGAVLFHCVGMVYMFVALAIVCDEFFVPSLDVIIEKLKISEDVAGATFMAAGGSAPELATSLIATFLATDNSVGIGTIVGSAVFNILFVIGMCAIFSKQVLVLTWWPLFRDCSFYSIFLGVLIGTYYDGYIQYWESIILLLCYAIYVTFMKFNHHIEAFVKNKILRRNRITQVQSTSKDNLVTAEQRTSRTGSIPYLRGGSAKFRHGILQLMIHTIDPLHEGKVHDKAIQLHAIASLNVTINPDTGEQCDLEGNKTQLQHGQISINGTGTFLATTTQHGGQLPRQASQQTTITSIESLPDNQDCVQNNNQVVQHTVSTKSRPDTGQASTDNTADSVSEKSQDDGEDDEEPLDMSWPETPRKRLTYILVAPIVFPLWLLLPDVRRPEKRKWFACTFIGSILFIGGFSYLMVWFAKVTGIAAGITDAVMGITFIAAGTSIPDLITSVIVARKGFGDMAVSSSVGSNIFDITVGLPFPWLLWSIAYGGCPVTVDREGLLCSILLLLAMLIVVICCIAAFKWKMNKLLGAFMFFLYAIFLTIALLLLYNFIPCPVI